MKLGELLRPTWIAAQFAVGDVSAGSPQDTAALSLSFYFCLEMFVFSSPVLFIWAVPPFLKASPSARQIEVG